MLWSKKYQDGGPIYGPSHDEGGVQIPVSGGQDPVIEAEGGEFVVKKEAVNPRTQAVLEYINKTGSMPKYRCGGHITDARKRRK